MRYQIRLLLHQLCCVWEYVFSPVSLEWTRTLWLVWFYCDCFLHLKDSIVILITDNKKYCMMLHVYVCTVHVSLLVCLFVCLSVCLFVCWLVLIPSIFKYQTYAIWDLISPLKSFCAVLSNLGNHFAGHWQDDVFGRPWAWCWDATAKLQLAYPWAP